VILRSVMRHVRDQNWFAVFLDFLIVVVGVFIGIQVANWNDAQVDRRLGKEYEGRLVSELQQDLIDKQTLYGYYNAVLEGVENADRLLSETAPDPQALIAAAYRASEWAANPTNSATWDEIVSSGHIGLLPGEALESDLLAYYKFQDSNESVVQRLQDSRYRLAVRSLIPLGVQLAIREGCSDVLDEVQMITGFVAECRLNVDPLVLEETARTLQGSTEIRETLRYQYSMLASVLGNLRGNVAMLNRVLEALDAETIER
jgi:hypothetical protein